MSIIIIVYNMVAGIIMIYRYYRYAVKNTERLFKD